MPATSSYESLSYSRWDCKYHIVFVPKYRKKQMYGGTRVFLRDIFGELANQKGCEIISGSLANDHVHMLLRVPPKYAVAEVVGYLKEKKRDSSGTEVLRTQEKFQRGTLLCERIYSLNC